MRIKYVASRGISPIFATGVVGEDRVWTKDQVREYGPNDELTMRYGGSAPQPANAIDTILALGTDFVDADTGKNPKFVCVTCGGDATSTGFHDRFTLAFVTYQNAAGEPLCISDYLAENPRYIDQHKKCVSDFSIITRAQEIIGAREAKATQDAERAAATTPAPRSTFGGSTITAPATDTKE